MVSSTFLISESWACLILPSQFLSNILHFLTKVNKDMVPDFRVQFSLTTTSTLSIGIRQWRKIQNLLQNLLQRLVKPKWINRIIQDKRTTRKNSKQPIKTKQTNVKLKLVSTISVNTYLHTQQTSFKKDEIQSCSGLLKIESQSEIVSLEK